MKKLFKDNWSFLLLVLIGGLVGGYCLGIYMYDTLSPDLLKQLQEENITKEIIALSTMFQYGIMYGLLLAILGIIISKKVKLWKKFKLTKKALITTLIITIISALVLFPGDKLLFGPFSDFVKVQYETPPTIYKILGGLLVGGIIEEVIMRLFLMSLLVLIISKILKKKNIPLYIYILSNIISSFLFALGHIPSTMSMTTLTPILVFRCFLFNGGLGLTFGYLYRKYGILYAMTVHGFAHLISDILMIIFI